MFSTNIRIHQVSNMAVQKNLRRALTITQPACLTDGSDADFRRLIDTMLAFSARLLALRDSLGALAHLRGVQYSTLAAIAYRADENHLTINGLAEHLHLSGAFVTIETGKLQKLGLIDKTANPADKREVLLSITEAGLDLLRDLSPDQRSINDLLFDSVTRKEFDGMNPIFKRLVQNADRAILQATHLVAMQKTD